MTGGAKRVGAPRVARQPLADTERRDLTLLTTPKGQSVARRLAPYLVERKYHEFVLGKVNREDPIVPLSRSVVSRFLAEQQVMLDFGMVLPPDLWMPWLFFHIGMPLDTRGIDTVFDKSQYSLIDDALDVGLFLPTKENGIRMNGLGIAAEGTGGERFFFYAVDWLHDFKDPLYPLRVYSAIDSRLLMWRLAKLDSVTGCIGEAGSGTGLQCFSLLQRNAGITHAYGLEIDARARNVSLFNAHLNGLQDRFSVCERPEELRAALGSNRLTLALSNPPFIALPEWVEIDEDEMDKLPSHVAISRDGEKRRVPMLELHGRPAWGGADGLAVTRGFFQEFLPLLSRDGQMILYGQWGGTRLKPTKVLDLLESMGRHPTFEPVEEKLFSGSRSGHAELTGRMIEAFHPALKGTRFAKRLRQSVDQELEAQGIDWLHSGCVVVPSS